MLIHSCFVILQCEITLDVNRFMNWEENISPCSVFPFKCVFWCTMLNVYLMNIRFNNISWVSEKSCFVHQFLNITITASFFHHRYSEEVSQRHGSELYIKVHCGWICEQNTTPSKLSQNARESWFKLLIVLSVFTIMSSLAVEEFQARWLDVGCFFNERIWHLLMQLLIFYTVNSTGGISYPLFLEPVCNCTGSFDTDHFFTKE